MLRGNSVLSFFVSWEQRKVGEFWELITGTTPSTSDVNNYNGDYLFVSPADIQGNRFVKNTITTLSEKGFCKCRRLKADSVLFVSIGSTIGKVAQIKEIAVTNQQINAIIPNEKYNPNFVYSLLENKAEDIKKQASAQAVPIINKTTFGEIECFVTTSKEEQTKISKILLNIDNLITLHQSKYDKLVNVKKALLEKMFPKDGKNVPEIRFKGFTDTWEQRKFKNYFDERNERTGIGEMISVTISSGIKKFSELNRYDSKPDDLSKYKRVVEGDIAYNSMRMWQGASGYSPYTGILSPAYTVIKPKDGISAKFFSYQIKRPEMIHQFELNSQGLTKDTLNLKFPAFSEIETTAPIKVNEQNKIAKLLEKVDNLITLHQHKLEKLKNMKKSLLNKMFI